MHEPIETQDFRATWQSQPTTLFRMSSAEMQKADEQIERRQRGIARGLKVAMLSDVLAFSTLLFFFPNPVERAGSVWIMAAMAWFVRRLYVALDRAGRAREEMATRPSIDGFRASLEARLAFYRSMLAFGAVLPGVALFMLGGVLAAPESLSFTLATAGLLGLGIARGFQVHFPHFHAIRAQLAELDRL